jgi:putative membrane protein
MGFDVHDLPTLNASLNAASALLLAAAYHAIRRREIERHHRLMLIAVATSTLFLISYLVYHAQVGSIRFQGQGTVRPVYFTILITHTILAVVIVPMILRTLYLAWKGRFFEHRRLARWTFPLWMYVSVTGVVIYVMLYRLYPSGGIR